MSLKLTYNEVDRLIVRYQSGDSSSQENKMLLDWVKCSDDNKAYFANNMSLLDAANKPRFNFDSNRAFENFKNQAFEKKAGVRRILNFTPLVRIAASILVILSISIITLSILNRDVEQITLISEVQVLNEDLPDDSQVALQKGSKIVYPSRFVEDHREVEVAGQVFFEVQRNEKKPFVVHAGPVDIEVLGTSFDVHNDTILKTITVTVETGKVKVTYPENNFVTYLDPKEQCVINWGEKTAVEEVIEDENYKGWLTGVLVFESSPLNKVVRDLNSLYSKKIFIGDKVLNSCMLTTKIDNLPQAEVIGMLEKSLNLEVIDNGEMYILIGEGCSQ